MLAVRWRGQAGPLFFPSSSDGCFNWNFVTRCLAQLDPGWKNHPAPALTPTAASHTHTHKKHMKRERAGLPRVILDFLLSGHPLRNWRCSLSGRDDISTLPWLPAITADTSGGGGGGGGRKDNTACLFALIASLAPCWPFLAPFPAPPPLFCSVVCEPSSTVLHNGEKPPPIWPFLRPFSSVALLCREWNKYWGTCSLILLAFIAAAVQWVDELLWELPAPI